MSESSNLNQTPLYGYYKENNVKMIDFGGWALPIHFTSIIEEHETVRTKAGLFDVSHMGEILIEGANATAYLNHLLTNNIASIQVNQAQYNAMCHPNGGTIDDLIVFKLSEEKYLMTPNAANKNKVWDWMNQHSQDNVTLKDLSTEMGLLALQGPKAEAILSKLSSIDLNKIQSYHFLPETTVAGISNVLIARTGYTGEDGFELYTSADQVEKLWHELLTAGTEEGIKPCGLGARDTLRLEAGLSLYGHELSDEITPLEGGIGFAVKTKKVDSFIGQEKLAEQRNHGLKRKIRGIELLDKGIAREGYPIYSEAGEEVGLVTSGTKSPTLNKSIGLVLIQDEYTTLGTTVYVGVRKKKIAAQITNTPFYKR
ncbi:glycine cleavage system aminomethyltransferase GcvT [Desemzia sp. RIT804]|uniref:glycine cleavage system aminomethyltransferase GcvT n=1 Tax=Desemzia sp. RIT 804 TaxID=2810209 RepID=UPI00194F6A3A|nr:glycine cleavage system aminomethyltransferase GcvT [Desemzia sp. RIT 804]MBM6613304.1 glycine cleavage system aminomethyltransferase GcvT [Desemzia sp. RIT 804]